MAQGSQQHQRELEGWRLLAEAVANARGAVLEGYLSGGGERRAGDLLELTKILDREIGEWEKKCKKLDQDLDQVRSNYSSFRRASKQQQVPGAGGLEAGGQQVRDLQRELKMIKGDLANEAREKSELMELNEKLWAQVAILQRKVESVESLSAPGSESALRLEIEDLKASLAQEKKTTQGLEEDKRKLLDMLHSDDAAPAPAAAAAAAAASATAPTQSSGSSSAGGLAMASAALEAAEKELSIVREQLHAANSARFALQQELADLRSSGPGASPDQLETIARLEKELVAAKSALEAGGGDKSPAEAPSDSMRLEVAMRLEAEAQELQVQLQAATDAKARMGEELAQARQEQSKAEKERASLSEDVASLQSKVESLTASKSKVEKLLQHYQQREDSEDKSNSLVSEKFLLLETNRTLREELEVQIREKLEVNEMYKRLRESLNDSSDARSRRIDDLIKDNATLNESLRDLRARLGTDAEERDKLSLSVKRLLGELDTKSAEAEELYAVNERLRQTLSELRSPRAASGDHAAAVAEARARAEAETVKVRAEMALANRRLKDDGVRVAKERDDLAEHSKKMERALLEAQDAKTKLEGDLQHFKNSIGLDLKALASGANVNQGELKVELIESNLALRGALAAEVKENGLLSEAIATLKQNLADARAQLDAAPSPAGDAGAGDSQALREELARKNGEIDRLHTHLQDESVARTNLERDLHRLERDLRDARQNQTAQSPRSPSSIPGLDASLEGSDQATVNKKLREQLWKIHLAHDDLKKNLAAETKARAQLEEMLRADRQKGGANGTHPGGQFTLDPKTAEAVEAAVASKSVSYDVVYKGATDEQWQLLITQKHLKIVTRSGQKLKIPFSTHLQLYLHPSDPRLFFIQVSQQGDSKGYEMMSPSSMTRNLLVLSIRAFFGGYIYSQMQQAGGAQ